MSEAPGTLPFADLETAYETIAETIDALPEGQERLFLAKLCLALAHRVSDLAEVDAAISEARQNLDE